MLGDGRKAYLTPTMIGANEVNETSIFLSQQMVGEFPTIVKKI